MRNTVDLLDDVLTAVAGAEHSGRSGYRRYPDGSVVACFECGAPANRRGRLPRNKQEVLCQDCRRVTCRICGEPMCRGQARLPQGEAAHYDCIREYVCKFPGCGVEIDRDIRKRGTDRLLCRDHARNIDYIDRAQFHGAPFEIVDVDEVFSRCGWICGICELQVDPALRYPHKLSATLDHIVPLSVGPGSPGHVFSNCQLAHLCCNQLKSNRPSVDATTARELVLGIDLVDGLKAKPRIICPECEEPVMKSGRTFHSECWQRRLARQRMDKRRTDLRRERERQARKIPVSEADWDDWMKRTRQAG
jgi:hypothetical protein